MTMRQLLDRFWNTAAPALRYEEAENENLLRDTDAAMSRLAHVNQEIKQSQSHLLESIRLAKPDEFRETLMTMLERTKWRP